MKRCSTINALQTPAKAVFNFRIHRTKLDDPERPESIDNCTNDEERVDVSQPPHKHLTHNQVDKINSGDMISRKQKGNRRVKVKV